MSTNQAPEASPAAVLVNAELEALYERCAAAGLSRQDVKNQLSLTFVLPAIMDVMRPKPRMPELVEAAYQKFLAGDKAGCQVLALEWLTAGFNVTLGGLVEVAGWARDREVLVDEFEFWWPDEAADFTEGYMILTGPTAYGEGVAVKRNMTRLTAFMMAYQTPSARLRRKFPERF